MPASIAVPSQEKKFLARHPAIIYFGLTFTVSWLGAFAVAAPHLLRGEAIPKFAGLMMFPAMLLGPSLVGILLTRLVDGPAGLRDLFSRMRRLHVPPGWFAVLLIPPFLVLTVLYAMKAFVSPDFAPNRFFVGIGFGFVAGFFEEIGWMGFMHFPKCAPRITLSLQPSCSAFSGAPGTSQSSTISEPPRPTAPTGSLSSWPLPLP